MKMKQYLIAAVILGAISLIIGYIFIGMVAQTVTNVGVSSSSTNFAAYSSALSLVQLTPLFNAILLIVVAVAVAVGFLRGVGLF